MNDMSQAGRGIAETLGVGKKKWSLRKKSLVWLGGLGAVVLVLFFLFSGGGGEVGFKSEAVKRGPLSVKVTATGTPQPIDQVDVGAEVSGRVVEVKVDFNDAVKAGDVLAQIDTTQLEARRIQTEAQLAAAKAGVREAEASLADAARRLDRLKDLARNRTVSQQDLDTAQSNYDRAVASVEVAKAQVALQEAALKVAVNDIDKAVIRSPIDGIVLYRSVEPGQTVAASFQTPVLFTLASDIKSLELLADIDEADVGQVAEGQNATFTVDSFPNRSFEAQIRSLRNAPKKADGTSAAAAQGVVVYQAELTVNNEAFTWHPDQGGWTRSDLDERMAEPWFDLDDFRVTVDSPLTGFCWTKLHPAGTADPSVAVGEIYVIAVSPASAGRGQGAALTVAGLDHQWRTHGTPIGMLYVESTNDRALATYRRLGFEIAATDVAFEP